ncbi:glycosyltransferase [Sphaerisporangium dianthi]|uniref:Glycosyltransferase n=1 Tax=Sphaerisporangium dianthi TaxID=1436120 RepID=A0ABV9C8S1_9ACTN
MTPGRVLAVAQGLAAAAVLVRLARGRRRLPPLTAASARSDGEDARGRRPDGGTAASWPAGGGGAAISVVIPARDEEARIGPCLAAVLADPAVTEVIVVDDRSSDGTAALAASLGATVVAGRPLPGGWVGKQWALHQGLQRARGDVVVTLDADTRPRPGLFAALADALAGRDLVSAGPRFVCDGVAEQALHASFLATLVYRFGPIGSPSAPPPHRVVANGQCLAFRREAMLRADGFARVRRHMTDDVALARMLAADGWRVAFLDAGGLLEVDMHESAAGVWREWGRSLPLADVTAPGWRAADLAVVWLAGALPVIRLAAGRPTRLDLALLAVRTLLAGALRGSYTRPGPGVVLSVLLDPATAVRLTHATLRPVRTWRKRTYTGMAGNRCSAGPAGYRSHVAKVRNRFYAGMVSYRSFAGKVRNAVRSGPPGRSAAR